MDHVPDGVLIRGDQPGDRRHERARRRRHDDHRPPHPDRPVASAPHDLQQPPRPHRLSHLPLPTLDPHHKIECESITAACQPTR